MGLIQVNPNLQKVMIIQEANRLHVKTYKHSTLFHYELEIHIQNIVVRLSHKYKQLINYIPHK